MATADGAAAASCPRCTAGLWPDQDWCTNCGLAVTTRILPARKWRLRIFLIALVVLAAGAGIGWGFVKLTRGSSHTAAAPPGRGLVAPTGASGPTGVTSGTTPSGPTGPTVTAPSGVTVRTGATGATGPTVPPTELGTTGPRGTTGPSAAGSTTRRSGTVTTTTTKKT